jgi:hypothetical protein
MKSIALISWLALVCLLVSGSLLAQNKSVTVYSDEFAGIQTTLTVGKYDYMQLVRLGAGVVRSVRVPEGMMVTLYEKDDFQGNSLILTDDANKRLLSLRGFGEMMPNISLEVSLLPEGLAKAPFVTIYKDNFGGPSKKLRAGAYDFYELGAVDNDQVSSVKIPTGMKVILYEHKEMGGRSLEFTADVSASVLKEKNFNDATSSIFVIELPKPEPVVEKPIEKPTPEPVTQPKPVEEPKEELKGPFVTVFFGETSRRYPVGRYDNGFMKDLMGIRIPEVGLRITLYELPGFKGKSLTIEDDMITRSYLEYHKFLNAGSCVVEAIPSVVVYSGAYDGDSQTFYQAGEYHLGSLDIGNDGLSSVKVGPGFWVLLFEHDHFEGRSILLTKDASADFLEGKEFNDQTSSIIVSTSDRPLPLVTLFRDNMTGVSSKLTPGSHPLLELNNAVSSVEVPRGMRITLYEEPDFQGKSVVLQASIKEQQLQQIDFDNTASSAFIELLKPRDYMVTIYADKFSGPSQDLLPGEYRVEDIRVENNTVSSIHVPRGMTVTLYEHDKFEGLVQMVDRDTDFTGSRYQDNIFSSFVVKDIFTPIINNPGTITYQPPQEEEVVETPAEEIEPETEGEVQTPTTFEPPCEMSEKEFYQALKAIEGKPFSQEKMDMARLTTQDKCLTLDQIRQIAKQFQYEDQTLEFVKSSYERCKEKSQYYTLDDVFKFMSSKEAFMSFLKSKK